MGDEPPAEEAIRWEGFEPEVDASGAFEIWCEPSARPLVEEATGHPTDITQIWFRRTYLFSCGLAGARRILRVSEGYRLNAWLHSFHAGLDHKSPVVRAECERLLRELRTTEGVLYEGEDLQMLRMLDEALRVEGRRLADLPLVLLLPQGEVDPGPLWPQVVEIVRKELSDAALEASLQLPACTMVPVYPWKKRGYLEALATLARMIAARRGLRV